MIHPTHRRAGGLAPRLLLALAVLAGALAIAVARPRPAAAWSKSESADEIVLTSERLTDETVHATLILKVRRSGDVLFRVELHNSGRTRKYVKTSVTATFPNAAFEVSSGIPASGQKRIDKDTTTAWETPSVEPRLAQRWDRIQHQAIEARFHMQVQRVVGT
jgi:hypothetical protein